MKNSVLRETIKRRKFITRSFVAGGSLCLGCAHFFSSAGAGEIWQDEPFQERISGNSGMSYEQVFNFAYRDILIPQLKVAAKQLGREKLVEILKNSTDEVYANPDFGKQFRANLPVKFWNNVLKQEVLENSANRRIVKITECLWAKTFRESDAADFGYAMLCYGDYASARADRQKLERETTLMQGHDCCLLKWTPLG